MDDLGKENQNMGKQESGIGPGPGPEHFQKFQIGAQEIDFAKFRVGEHEAQEVQKHVAETVKSSEALQPFVHAGETVSLPTSETKMQDIRAQLNPNLSPGMQQKPLTPEEQQQEAQQERLRQIAEMMNKADYRSGMTI